MSRLPVKIFCPVRVEISTFLAAWIHLSEAKTSLCLPLNWMKRLRVPSRRTPRKRAPNIDRQTPVTWPETKKRNRIIYTVQKNENRPKAFVWWWRVPKPKPNTFFVWFNVWLADGSCLFSLTNQTAKQTQNQSKTKAIVCTFDSHSKTALRNQNHNTQWSCSKCPFRTIHGRWKYKILWKYN